MRLPVPTCTSLCQLRTPPLPSLPLPSLIVCPMCVLCCRGSFSSCSQAVFVRSPAGWSHGSSSSCDGVDPPVCACCSRGCMCRVPPCGSVAAKAQVLVCLTRCVWQLALCALCMCRHTSEQGRVAFAAVASCACVGSGAVCGLRVGVCGLRTAVLDPRETRSGTVVSVT